MPGEIAFGRYVLLDKLAAGGMAEIFLAHAKGEAGFRKICVVKRVLPHLALRPGFREMFLDEAKLAARLNHPGIAQIFDLGREGDDFYLAMEYLAGEDGGGILRRCHQLARAVPLEIAARIIASAAEALHYAHDLVGSDGAPLGIVHRDVSPTNLFVTYQGAVKLLDFGIARAEQRLSETKAGFVKGKMAYMAPEQALGQIVDRRADVWALGVCLHELITGTRLFLRENNSATERALVKEPIPSCRERRPEVPEELEAIVRAALERNPARRLPTADALRAELELFLSERTYVPSTVQLSQFLRDLFGAERAEARIRLGSDPGAGAVETDSGPIEGTPLISSASPIPDLDRTVPFRSAEPTRLLEPRRTARRSFVPIAGIVLVAAIAGGTAIGLLTRPPRPTPVAPVPAAPPPPEPAKTEAAPPEPTPEPVAEDPAPPAAEPEHAATHPRHAEPGWLSLQANVPVSAWIDGNKLGSLPVSRVKVTAGDHHLRLANPSLGLARTVKLRVRPGESVDHRADIALGTLNVTVNPWADVYLDGFKLGQTPLAGRQVAAAPHQLRLVGPNGEKSLKIDVAPSQTLVVREQLP